MTGGHTYQIQVQGRIGERWSLWFEDMAIRVDGAERATVTTLTGTVPDQAALLGLLHKLYTLGMPLLLVRRQPASGTGDLSGTTSTPL